MWFDRALYTLYFIGISTFMSWVAIQIDRHGGNTPLGLLVIFSFWTTATAPVIGAKMGESRTCGYAGGFICCFFLGWIGIALIALQPTLKRQAQIHKALRKLDQKESRNVG